MADEGLLTNFHVSLHVSRSILGRFSAVRLRLLIGTSGCSWCPDTWGVNLVCAAELEHSPASTKVTFVFSLGMNSLNRDPAATKSTYELDTG